MVRIPPRQISRTGDDAPARSVIGYTIRMSGWHQVWLGLVAVAGAALGLVPIELQRRIIDDGISQANTQLLAKLALVYLGALLLQQALKLVLRVSQGWLSESAMLYTRGHVLGLIHREPHRENDASGERVAVLTAEIDKLGGFVGEGPSTAAANIATLLGVLAYTFTIEPRIALVGVLLLVPQLVLAPLLQRKINRLFASRLRIMRAFGARVSELEHPDPAEMSQLYQNRMSIHIWKAVMRASLNLSNHVAPLGILVIGGFMVIDGSTTLGVLVAFISGFERLAGPARELIGFYRLSQQAEVQHRMIATWMSEHRPEAAKTTPPSRATAAQPGAGRNPPLRDSSTA